MALLQEVPPWWPGPLARAAGAQQRTALTSRNALLCARRAVAARRPELLKSNGGGSNAVLARAEIVEHRAVRLRAWPERRVAQLVRLSCGVSVANFHGSARVALAERELERLWTLAASFARGGPLVLGGDLNLRAPAAPAGSVHLASRDVDHLFAAGLDRAGEALVLERRVNIDVGEVELSDHPPLLAAVRGGARDPLRR